MFYLGTHEPGWLSRAAVRDTPLFVSRVRLERLKSWPKAVGRWAMDSGGYSALSTPPHRWPITVDRYAEEIGRAAEEVGGLDWAAPMDSMCEPHVLAGTGRSVQQHQEETVQRYLDLIDLVGVPVPPVLQGFALDDYWRCVDLYTSAGVDLIAAPLVGLGTVCRRQATREIGVLVESLAATGMRLHGFGVKLDGLVAYGRLLESADSMAWSLGARMAGPQPGCPHGRDGTGSCGNCLRYAIGWRSRVVGALDRATAQPSLCLRSMPA